jgi:hypothetical protein
MRQDCTIVPTRAFRRRHFPTQYGHAALHRVIGVTCVYQSDSSSKRPVAFVAFRTLRPPPHQQFSTCWRGRATTNTAPRAAAAYSEGAAPHRPALCVRSACGELLPTTPRHIDGHPKGAAPKTDAQICSRIDDRWLAQGKGHAQQRPRRCHMSKRPWLDKGRSISVQRRPSRARSFARRVDGLVRPSR